MNNRNNLKRSTMVRVNRGDSNSLKLRSVPVRACRMNNKLAADLISSGNVKMVRRNARIHQDVFVSCVSPNIPRNGALRISQSVETNSIEQQVNTIDSKLDRIIKLLEEILEVSKHEN